MDFPRMGSEGGTVVQLERETGIEPATSSLGSLRSTAELLPLQSPGAASARVHRWPRSAPNNRQDLVALLFHLLRGRRLEVQAKKRLRIRCPDVEVPVRI